MDLKKKFQRPVTSGISMIFGETRGTEILTYTHLGCACSSKIDSTALLSLASSTLKEASFILST